MPKRPDGSSIETQVARAAKEHGDAFDPTLLAVTLALFRAHAVYERAHAVELAPHALTVGHLNILTVLHRAGSPLTMSQLSQALSVRPTNLTAVVDALIKRKLVSRRINPNDRRSFLITTTAAGERFLAAFLPSHWGYLARLLDGLTAEQRGLLTDLLESLRVSVEASQDGQPLEA